MSTKREPPRATNLREQIASTVRRTIDVVESSLTRWIEDRSPIGFRRTEIELAGVMRELADGIAKVVLIAIVGDDEFSARCSSACRGSGDFRGGGKRTVAVTLLGGGKARVQTPYLKPDHRGRPGLPRKSGGRGRGGSGVYPVLAALGISFGVTPALAGEITRQVADSDSVRTGRAALARRGIDLGHKQTLRIVRLFGGRAVEQRAGWLTATLEAPPQSGPLSGQRVVVSVDGGRIRERVVKRGRRSKKTGHHRYDGLWREPKLFTIYTIDDKGQVRESFRPIIDGTMEDCNGVFSMLASYLRGLGAHEAKHLEFVGDGAIWIWERVDAAVELIGVPKNRVVQIVDWYHAVEVLGEVADLQKTWSEKARKAWVRRAKRRLHAGDIGALMKLFDQIAIGRATAEINTHRAYFVRNTNRMRYRAFKRRRFPIGSGGVESAIRRVINMRMKGCGTFWLRDNAEVMLLLRSYLKADRFDDLVDWSIIQAASWWQSAGLSKPIREAK